jgi:hypothetical protein
MLSNVRMSMGFMSAAPCEGRVRHNSQHDVAGIVLEFALHFFQTCLFGNPRERHHQRAWKCTMNTGSVSEVRLGRVHGA